MTALISPSGALLLHRARCSTTPAEQAEAKAVRVWHRKECRLEENRTLLKQRNVRAFLRAAGESGELRIDAATWLHKSSLMGLDSGPQATAPETRDLVAVEILRGLGALDVIACGDIWSALLLAAPWWSGLPQAPGAGGHFAPPASGYAGFCARYKCHDGSIDDLAGALSFGVAPPPLSLATSPAQSSETAGDPANSPANDPSV